MNKFVVATLSVIGFSVTAQAQVVEKKALTLDGARQVISAALAEAKKLSAPGGVIAVVDDGGNLVALERLDNTFAAGANISIGKARTSALFKKPTKVFEDTINKGRTTMVTVAGDVQGFTPLQGGVPIMLDGQVVGAVGVSGAASAQQDEELAIAGASAINEKSPPAPVTYLDQAKVAAAFAKGAPLHEVNTYKVHASRRTEPGLVEVHENETDVVYVLEGSATFVTGGKVVEGKTIAPGEIRGKDVVGGETRTLAKGDVVVVPPNTPHWFKEVKGPFLYFVVKPIGSGS
jgi:glc operon protein GlcG